jgi:beta-galactosidase
MKLGWAMIALVAACSAPPAQKPPFPAGFLWGAAIAGFQVDMGCPTLSAAECEDRNSDWYDFLARRAELPDLQDRISVDPISASPGHWELYAQDFERAKSELGLNGLRISLEWSRIFPTATDGIEGYEALKAVANPKALAKYHAMLAALKMRGMTPLVTLNHYTLPLWIHDGVACHKDLKGCAHRGWLDRERTVREIAKYAGFCGKEFGAEVDLWATQNEPFAVVLPGYLLPSAERLNPPAVSFQYDAAKTAMVAMIEGHARMYDALKANDLIDADGDGKASFVGLVYSIVPVVGKTDSKTDQRAAQNVFYLYNTAFLDGVAKGDLDAALNKKPVHREDLANRMDYLGINYYTRITVTGVDSVSLPDLSPLTTFDPTNVELGEDYARGIYEMAMHVKDRYGLPSIITETGAQVQTDASLGASWLVRYATWTKRAIKDGADIRGFFYWSLIDNFEWNHGMAYKFGLYGIDKSDPLKKRSARSAVAAYLEITKAKDIPAALETQFPTE